MSRQIIIKARKRYPQLNQTSFRILFQVLWLIMATVVMRIGITYAYAMTRFWGYDISLRAYWVNTLIPFLFTVPIFAIYEVRYLYHQWRTTYYESEQLKKENLQSQLDSLKAQINPHFIWKRTAHSTGGMDTRRISPFSIRRKWYRC